MVHSGLCFRSHVLLRGGRPPPPLHLSTISRSLSTIARHNDMKPTPPVSTASGGDGVDTSRENNKVAVYHPRDYTTTSTSTAMHRLLDPFESTSGRTVGTMRRILPVVGGGCRSSSALALLVGGGESYTTSASTIPLFISKIATAKRCYTTGGGGRQQRPCDVAVEPEFPACYTKQFVRLDAAIGTVLDELSVADSSASDQHSSFVPLSDVSSHLVALDDDAVVEELEQCQGLTQFFRERRSKYQLKRLPTGKYAVRLWSEMEAETDSTTGSHSSSEQLEETSVGTSSVASGGEGEPTASVAGGKRSPVDVAIIMDEVAALIPVDEYIPIAEVFLSLSPTARTEIQHPQKLFDFLKLGEGMMYTFNVTPDNRLVVRLQLGLRPPDMLLAMSRHSVVEENTAEGNVAGGGSQQQEGEAEGDSLFPAPAPFPFKKEKKVVIETLAQSWKKIDVAAILPYIPPFFVSFAFIFEKLPENIRTTMPKARRPENIVSMLVDYCDFVLPRDTAELKIRLKEGIEHPAIDGTKASILYKSLVPDDDALIEFAQLLPLEEIDMLTLDMMVSAELRAKVWKKKGGRVKQLSKYPFMFIVGNNGQSVSSLLSIHKMPAAEVSDPSSATATAEHAALAEVWTLLNESASGGVPPGKLQGMISDTAKASVKSLGGLGKFLAKYRRVITIDDSGDISCRVNAACSNRLGTLITRDQLTEVVATEDDLDNFRFSDRRRNRRLDKVSERYNLRPKSRHLRDPDELLKLIASFVPTQGYIDYAHFNENLPQEAKAHLKTSLLKYLLYYRKVFDVQEELDGFAVKYSVRKRRAGEELHRENLYDDDEAAINLVSLHVHPERGSSIFSIAGHLPASARQSLRRRYGGVTNFCKSFPEIFTVVVSSQGRKKYVFFTGTEIPFESTPLEGGDEQGEGEEDNGECNHEGGEGYDEGDGAGEGRGNTSNVNTIGGDTAGGTAEGNWSGSEETTSTSDRKGKWDGW